MSMLLQFSIHNSQFSMNYQFSFINVGSVCEMANEKLMSNAKCKLVNATGGSS